MTSTPRRDPRDADGRCRPSRPDEVGELLAEYPRRSPLPGGALRRLRRRGVDLGKILRGVFDTDDSWFRTGDLMRRDTQRLFLLRRPHRRHVPLEGRDVSTTEVAEAIAPFRGVKEAIVYGVAVPGYEGRAGMAALVVDNFAISISRACATMSRTPCRSMPGRCSCASAPNWSATSTFKPKKSALVADGFDPDRTRRAALFRRPRRAAYARVDADFVAGVKAGAIQL